MKCSTKKFNAFFDRFFLINFLILSMGIPLLFTSLTRSVFEVNKLLLLRLVILVVYGAWILKSLILKENKLEADEKDCYVLFGFRFRKIGLEIPMILWIFANLMSIFLSKSIIISIIGSYDRWEGLATILNYLMLFYMVAKLINNTRYRLLIFMLLLFSTSISSIYGIVQSLGLDFMNWSTSPTKRVFACINNPVHFCAYVAMTVPIGISLTHYFIGKVKLKSSTEASPTRLALIGCIVLAVIFYALLFTASFMAFVQYAVLVVLGIKALNLYRSIIPPASFLWAFLAYLLLIGSLLLFKLFLLSPIQAVALIFTLLVYFCLSAYSNKDLFLYRLTFCTTLIVFYSMFLSYSRATLIGFCVSMATFYQLFFLTKQSNTKQILSVASLFFANLLATFSIIFKLQNHTRLIDTAVLFIIFLLYYYGSHVRLKKVTDFILHLPVFICVMLLFKSSQIVIHLSALLALVMYIATFSSRLNKAFLRNILLSFTFILLCFFTVHFSYLAIASVFLALLFLIIKEGDDALLNTFQVTSILILFFILVVFSVYPIFLHNLEQQFGLLIQTTPLISFVLYAVSLTIVFWQLKPKTVLYSSAVIAIVAVSTLAYSSFHAGQIIPEREKKQKLTTSRTIAGRMGGLAQHATHNPRLYMWLSVPPWVMDRPIFGTGPDTVRFLYPRYRHPEYGNAEGGHNFTPDRLHNEYFNTITTVGIFGFVVKYIFLFGGWYLILIRLFNKHINSNKKLVIMGALCAPTIYSIQVIFNFGVVATLFLFYFLMGLGLSFVNDEYEHEN